MDLQFPLLLIAIAWTGVMWWRGRDGIAFVVSANLAVNIIFFVTHPLFTPYYTVPAAALSLWTLLYGSLISSGTGEATVSPVKLAASGLR
jgi:cbb3-type cytochrome oxidase subunit 1